MDEKLMIEFMLPNLFKHMVMHMYDLFTVNYMCVM